MPNQSDILHIETISQLMRELGLPTPLHPLVALVDYENVTVVPPDPGRKLTIDFYKVAFKDKFHGQVKYGQGHYDFDEGGLAFIKPKQVVTMPEDANSYEGFALYFHPDLLRNYILGSAISRYGFFSYDVSEALFLSAKEKEIIHGIFTSIALELANNIDQFSQDILVSQIELLLNFSNRFYNRQFITRKTINHEIIHSLDKLLEDYFQNNIALKHGLPTVQDLCRQLNLSPRYLSDLLGSLTGRNTQQYIQDKILDQSKDLLSTTSMSVSEVAYILGFEHPQSFIKFFRSKSNMTPLKFRQAFN
ncbi:MAG: AraC family transcriptional regulator [Chitinophagaceae bacterium]|nr:MAG: AraC family transcriptional regulator [Chitinophagaceae bacterium]